MAQATGPTPFGRYRLLRKLGRGGMAEVFLAQLTQGEVARYLAIKRLLPAFSTKPEIVERLAAEARLTVWLTHPNIVQVYDFGRIGDDYYIAMEYVDGCDLRALLRPRKAPGVQLPMEVAVEIAYRLLDALRYAHSCTDDAGRALGIIHRDVSPHNILVARDGYPKLADFGIARARAALAVRYETQPGAVLGKYNYMAPEQASGREYDARVDLFAAGATLYQMLTGERAFRDREAQLRAGLFLLPRPPSELRPSIPKSLDELVLRAMAPDPADRFQSASQMAAALLQELVNLGGPPKPHQLRGVVAEALRARGLAPELDPPGPLEAAATAEHSLIGDQVTAVHRAMRSGIMRGASLPALPITASDEHAEGGEALRGVASQEITGVQAVPADPGVPRLPTSDTPEPSVSEQSSPTAPPARARPPLALARDPRAGAPSRLPRYVALALALGVALLIFGLGLLLGRSLAPRQPAETRTPPSTAQTPPRPTPPPRAPHVEQPAPRPPASRPVMVATASRPAPLPSGSSPSVTPRPRPRPRFVGAARSAGAVRSVPVLDPEQAAELLRRAQEAFVSGNHQRAVALSLRALKLKPESTAALQIWGAASCYMKRERDARAAAARLPKGSRDMLRRVCQPHGIRL